MRTIISTAVMGFGILSSFGILVGMGIIEWNLIDLRQTYWLGGKDYLSNPHYHELRALMNKLGLILMLTTVIATAGGCYRIVWGRIWEADK